MRQAELPLSMVIVIILVLIAALIIAFGTTYLINTAGERAVPAMIG